MSLTEAFQDIKIEDINSIINYLNIITNSFLRLQDVHLWVHIKIFLLDLYNDVLKYVSGITITVYNLYVIFNALKKLIKRRKAKKNIADIFSRISVKINYTDDNKKE